MRHLTVTRRRSFGEVLSPVPQYRPPAPASNASLRTQSDGPPSSGANSEDERDAIMISLESSRANTPDPARQAQTQTRGTHLRSQSGDYASYPTSEGTAGEDQFGIEEDEADEMEENTIIATQLAGSDTEDEERGEAGSRERHRGRGRRFRARLRPRRDVVIRRRRRGRGRRAQGLWIHQRRDARAGEPEAAEHIPIARADAAGVGGGAPRQRPRPEALAGGPRAADAPGTQLRGRGRGRIGRGVSLRTNIKLYSFN